MELICYLHPGWNPVIRPAEVTRDWMSGTPEAFAYRCLPLNIANAHGWEVLNSFAFDARWTGGTGTDAVEIRPSPDAAPEMAPVSIFGQGILTFHIAGLFRTSPGWNLWIGGTPNRFKDGIQPLTGVVETDWAPFTFTMNWRFTRADTWIHFDAQEPICFFFPVQRSYLEGIAPKLVPMEAAPEVLGQFKAWSKERDAFHARMAQKTPQAGSDKWQKHYYRGVDVSGKSHIDDHVSKLRLAPFTSGTPMEADVRPAVAEIPIPVVQSAAGNPEADLALQNLRKRDWLLNAVERQRELSPAMPRIERRNALSREEFLERYYAPGRPVILENELEDWPALARWSPSYLRDAVGSSMIEYQGGRNKSERFEMYKDDHRREMPFDRFIDLICQSPGNDAYVTAYNSARNAKALSVLHADVGFLSKFLSREVEQPNGMMWIGPAGTITSLHHDLTNNFIAQIVGKKQLKIVPAADVGKLYNHRHVFSEIADLDDPALDHSRFPLLADARVYDVTLNPGEIIYMPLGWWHQVKSCAFSVTTTYTNFLWPNDGYKTYPADPR